jgi:hypothetical protein
MGWEARHALDLMSFGSMKGYARGSSEKSWRDNITRMDIGKKWKV